MAALADTADTEQNTTTATLHIELDPVPTMKKQAGAVGRLFSYLTARSQPYQPIEPGTGLTVHSTAYAPSPYQTDSTPCITAAGTKVRPGVVAANFLPIGTLIEMNGEVYIVEDRMNPRYKYAIDIYFPSTSEALEFGSQTVDIVILGYGEPGQELPRERPPEEQEADIEIVVVDPPKFTDKVIGRIGHWRRVAGSLIGVRSYDVNRYDVDCFS